MQKTFVPFVHLEGAGPNVHAKRIGLHAVVRGKTAEKMRNNQENSLHKFDNEYSMRKDTRTQTQSTKNEANR
jgi:hypothetical protein